MSKEVSGIITRRYCNACGYLARQCEVPPLNINIRCPKCGEERFEYKGLLSIEFQSGMPGTNSCECPHCTKKCATVLRGEMRCQHVQSAGEDRCIDLRRNVVP